MKVFDGKAEAASPNFFYPERNVLGYSDTFFGLALPHSVFRLLGADRFLAVQLATMFLTALGFVGMYSLLHGVLRFARSTALIGASLFLISNMYYVYVVHPYILVSAVTAPWVVALAGRYWQEKDAQRARARAWLCLCGVLLALVLYTSYYIGWFLVFCSATVWVLYVACSVFVERQAQPVMRILRAAWKEKWSLLLGGIVFLAALFPFFMLYLPSLHRNGTRSLAETLSYMPGILGVLDVGRDNLVWGGMAARFEDFMRPGGMREHPVGWPPLTVCLFLATAFYCGLRLCRADQKNRDAEMRMQCLMSAIALACLTLWSAGVKIGEHAPVWAALVKLVPGAAVIRVPQRIDLVLNIGVVVVCTFGLEKLVKALPGRGALAYSAVVLLIAALAVEQRNLMPTHAISRVEEARKFSRVPPPPKGCAEFYISTWSDDHFGKIVLQTDGMLIAQQFVIPTFNGTSSWFPERWNFIDMPKGHAREEAFAWARQHGLSEGLCSLDMNAGIWSKMDLSHYDPGVFLGDPVEGKVADPGFEDSDIALWAPYQEVHATVNRTQAHSGTQSLAESDGAGSVWQDVPGLQPGQRYRLSAWVAASPGATAGAQIALFDFGIKVSTLSKTLHPGLSATLDPGTNWRFLSDIVTVSEPGTVRIHLFRTEGTGTIYWDDVKLDLDKGSDDASPQN